MMNPARVLTVVVNWELKENTAECLQSLQALETPTEIVVVDNGSKDGSVEYITNRFPQVHVLALPENLGFGAACNRAIREKLQIERHDFVFLLNNDAVVHPSAMSHLLALAGEHPEAGIFGPKIYFNDPPDKIWYAGARRRRMVLAAADTGRGEVDYGQFDTTRQVDYVFGAAMLIRREVLEQAGLLDESFFLYLEDLDLCLRAGQAGFKSMFVPQAKVWHLGSASTAQNLSLRKFHYIRSTIFFLKKHVSLSLIAPVASFWALVFMRMVFSDVLNGKPALIQAYWSGIVQGLREARRIKNINGNRRAVTFSFLENRLD